MKLIWYFLFALHTPDPRKELAESLAYHARQQRSIGWKEKDYINVAHHLCAKEKIQGTYRQQRARRHTVEIGASEMVKANW